MSAAADVKLLHKGLRTWTQGLAQGGHPELRVEVSDASLLPESEAYLHHVVNYLVTQHIALRTGETLSYGYWLTKFLIADDRFLEVWEYNADATTFVRGATLTLTYWRDQHQLCERVQAQFLPPRQDKLVAISPGVMEGDPVEAVRYPSPEHMSGWWITTDRYDGNVHSLRTEHLYHVTAARPELARYLALPHGFRVDLRNGERVWFDQEVAKQPVE